MNMRTTIPLALALLLGLVTLKFGRTLLTQRQGPIEGPTQTVLVAMEELTAGHAITAGEFQAVRVSDDMVPGQSFNDERNVLGRVLAVTVPKGLPLTETLLAPQGTTQGLQAVIPTGKRAVSVDVNEVTGLSGMIVPGSTVDVIATLTDDDTHESVTRTVVQDVLVSAVGTRMTGTQVSDHDAYGKLADKTVTLLVNPDQAQALDMAYTKAKPRLVLRNATETENRPNVGLQFAQLFRGQGFDGTNVDGRLLGDLTAWLHPSVPAPLPPVPVATPARPRRAVEIIRGTTESTVYFDNSGEPVQADSSKKDKGSLFE
jgi:pilus assembly protein CpaB